MQLAFDSLVVVDLAVTSWDGSPPPGEASEIIEVGAAAVDLAAARAGAGPDAVTPAQAVIVQPSRSRIGPDCRDLTGLADADVAAGVAFMDACDWLRKVWMSHLRVCATFAPDVATRIAEQCRFAEARTARITKPLSPRRLDLETLATVRLGSGYPLLLEEALDGLGLPPCADLHRAGPRARSAAEVAAALLRVPPAG